MKLGCTLFSLLCSALTITITAHAQTPDTITTAPYLLAGAPTPDLSTSQFREDSNSQNPGLPLNEFRTIDSGPDKVNLAHAAGKINENLYTSTAPGHGTLKIKNTQITWLLIQGPEREAVETKAQAYIVAVIRALTSLMTKTQSQKELQPLLTAGKNKRYYTETEGTLHYIIADNDEKELTFAVEPIKLVLSESFEGLNK